ncbi:MAG: PAS domain-containing protein [Alphaproteobacteria bacterium]|nr:PAS domain-containing protein [Alphaproteobacteria bacterium]
MISADIRSKPDLMASILASLAYPVVVVDDGHQFVFVNGAAEEFFRSSIGVMMGQNLATYFGEQHPIYTMLVRARSTRSSVSEQGLEILSDRLGRRLVNLQVTPLVDHAGRLVLSIQERALAERMRGQEQFRGAARSITSISALLAHEIKNPLAGIRGAAELIQKHPDGDNSALTELIMTETDRIAALLTRMENLAGGKPIDRLPVNVHEIIDHSIRLAENSFGREREINASFDPSLPDALGDRDLLIQALLNLIKNACEASDINGKIYIKTYYDISAGYALNSARRKSSSPLIIEVQDNGVGIPKEMQPYIFDPFFTSKSNGSGLGLALVASTIADHGGTIDVNSRPGHTSFRVGLPMAEGH